MTDTVWPNELDWTEYEKRVHADSPVVMLPVGALEQHGPHLPLCCDTVIPEHISPPGCGQHRRPGRTTACLWLQVAT